MITEEKKREYLQIARLIKKGALNAPEVLDYFEVQQEQATEMINFWLTYNDFTQSVVNYLAIEKLRIKFERCYRKEMSIWNLMKYHLKHFMNLKWI